MCDVDEAGAATEASREFEAVCRFSPENGSVVERAAGKRAPGLDGRYRRAFGSSFLLLDRASDGHVWRKGAALGGLLELIVFGFLLIVSGIGGGGRLNEQEVLSGCGSPLLQEKMLLVGRGLGGDEMLLGGVVVLAGEQLLLGGIGVLLEEEVVSAGGGGDEQVGAGALCFDEQQMMMGCVGLRIEQEEVVLRGCSGLQQEVMVRAGRCYGQEMMRRAGRALEQKMRVRGCGGDGEQVVGGSGGGLEQ